MTPWILQTNTVKICNEMLQKKKKKKVSSDFRTIFNLNQARVCDSFIPWCMTIYNTIACWEQIWRLIWKERKKYPQLKNCATCFSSVALQSQLLMCCDIYQECKFWQIIMIFITWNIHVVSYRLFRNLDIRGSLHVSAWQICVKCTSLNPSVSFGEYCSLTKGICI